MSDEIRIKILGLNIGNIRRVALGGKPKFPKDGDGDGMFTMPGSDEDKTPLVTALRYAIDSLRSFRIKKFELRQDSPQKSEVVRKWLIEAKSGGFTADRNLKMDVKQGISVGRNKHGMSVDMDKVFDENGEVREDAIDRVIAWMEYHGERIFDEPLEGARQVGIGAWVEKGMFYIDVVDIYENNEQNRERAYELGKAQNQKSIAFLERLWRAKETNEKEDWDNAFLTTDGDGADTIPWYTFDPIVEMMRSKRKPSAANAKPAIVEPKNMDRTGPENVTMQLAEPIPMFAKHLNGDFSDVVAVAPEKRQRIADHYDLQPEVDEKAKKAYDELKEEVERQFEMLREMGITVEFVDYDPYDGFHSMRKDVVENKRLKVMKTSVTGSHPYWDDDTNDKFRAVHDVFGHLATGRGFDRHGEEAAYQAHKSMMPESVHGALAMETRGQNAFVLARGDFPKQKAGILPDELAKRLRGSSRSQIEGMITADDDNLYEMGGSHHISGGRYFKNNRTGSKQLSFRIIVVG